MKKKIFMLLFVLFILFSGFTLFQSIYNNPNVKKSVQYMTNTYTHNKKIEQIKNEFTNIIDNTNVNDLSISMNSLDINEW